MSDAFREKIARDLGRELSGDDHEIENMLADVDSFMEEGQPGESIQMVQLEPVML